MSDEELDKLFDYGTSILDQAKLNPHSLNYGDLLAEAKRHIDQAVSSADRDDPKFSNDINTCASVHAFCLALVDYSSELDSYFASSPAIKRMNGWAHESPARLEKEPYDDGRELDDFWAGIEQIQDDQYTLLDKPELLSYEVWATSTKVFCEAISYSNPSGSLYHVWYLCLSVVFYLKIEVVNPSEVALCISSLTKAGALNDSKGDSLPDDLDPYLSDCIKHILHNPQIEFRLNSLKDLAAFYTQRQLSIFKKRWDAYQTGSGEFSADLDDAISASFEGLLWSKDTGVSREIRFELIFGYARASYERFNATDQQRWDDLEDPIDFLQEIKRYSETENFEVANARQLFATMLAELAYMLSKRPETGDWEKSLAYWEESVLMTQSKDPHLAERLFELGNLALKIYRTSEDGKFEYYLKACDAYERATDAAADTALVAEIQFSLASVLYHNFLDTHVQEDFDKSIKAGASACNLVFRTPELAQRRPHWSGIYGHCVVLLRSVQEDFNEDDEALTKRLERIIDLAELILPHSHPLQLMAMNRFGLAHALLARIKHRAAQPTLTCLDSLEKALELHKTALEKTCANDPFLHVRLAFVGIIHYQISELPDVNSSHLDLSVNFLWRARSACRKSLDYSMRLAKALEDRYKLLGKPSDLKECISILTEEGLVGHMKTSLDAAVQLARACIHGST
ncbi:unnamed protein product [Rhizoctonia solani]|uniref:Uncharacterized protein n=1 Tax=Rhizoctonia solani TaxID=456999 RepID=A0A8H2WU48_9AGAM|nr:unnamed protein product [Rhizoctonia solani]